MPTPIFVVDAFAEGPFSGNPAGVVPLSGPASDDWMQNVAMEMNHAETAFTWPEGELRRLRWFTPAVEVDLCGHATLATAHTLWESGLATGELTFITRSGELVCRQDEGRISMSFPADRPEAISSSWGPGWETGERYRGRDDLMIVLASEADVREFQPDFAAIAKLPARGLIVTAPAGGDIDFVSRFFAPQSGIDEDPVTGSAHCLLAEFWGPRLGKSRLSARQISRRGGRVEIDRQGDRIELSGVARTFLRGELVAGPAS